MTEEIWMYVPSMPGVEASSFGRVRGKQYGRTGAKTGVATFGSRYDRGYMAFQYRKARRLVHRIVAEAFYGQSPFEGAVVMHLDDNPSNNRPSNLRWATQGENLVAEGRLKRFRAKTVGENHWTAKRRRAAA